MKKITKYLNIATKLLSDVYKDDIATVANIVCAHADKDYETIYNQIEMKDPEDIGKELSSYLSSRPRVPSGIDEFGTNNIVEWINKL